MTAETMMKEYHNLKNRMIIIKSEIQNFTGISDEDMIEVLNFIHPNEEIIKASRISDKTSKIAISYRENIADRNTEWLNHLIAEYFEINGEIVFFETALSLLSGCLPQFMRKLVIEKRTGTGLESDFSISRTTVGKYRKKAIRELNRIYADREKSQNDFMLS